MSGIRFCSECLNILHPEEEKNEHRLLFVCKSCDYREYIQDIGSMEENKIYQRDFMQSFTESFIDPDYCLDPTMPREKVICPNCRYTECAYLIDREPGDKFLRKIYICGRVGKNGRPDCKSIFTSLKYIKLVSRGETYAYREYGNSSDVLILLHGNFTSSYVFERTFSKLSEGFRVIAPDLRGFGLSSYANKLKSIDDLAEDLSSLLGELKITKFCLLGWDLGAAVALKFAANFPTYLDKLILVNPIGLTGKTYVRDPLNEENPIPEWPEDLEEVQSDPRVIQFVNALKDRKKDFFKTYFTEEIFTASVPENERLDSYLDQFIAQKNLEELIPCLIKYDITELGTNEIFKIQTDTLILCGKEDFKTPLNEAIEIKKTLGEISTIKVFEESGHVLMEDNLEDFVENIAEFCLTAGNQDQQDEEMG
jgi:pimeloyl-ACP methyl ester carboxylesterase/DNA-directed RNA polymerase subunit M/transcription elongation factor TFIIS